ncbi:glyoxylase, beta-lactamase superfamily II [Bacteroidales bacterium 6E]|nr:glyoxylase, beta-lactamase superfamily II [Bacteroidales bacterium 6E]
MKTKLIPIWAGDFKADGGAMFGVIPKVLWNKEMPCDDRNFVQMTMRCLLIDQGDRKILIETGTGDHYPEKFMINQGLTEGEPLLFSLAKAGYDPHEITDVMFTHLHWDHVNGAIRSNKNQLELNFPNARHWCGSAQWEHAHQSNLREKVTFFTNFFAFLEKSGTLHLVNNPGEIFPGVSVRFYSGHTPGQMIPFIQFGDKTIVYTADLIPTAAHIPILWIAAYDLFPVTTMEEKQTFLKEACENGYILLFEHDFYTECVTIECKGNRPAISQRISINDITDH